MNTVTSRKGKPDVSRGRGERERETGRERQGERDRQRQTDRETDRSSDNVQKAIAELKLTAEVG